MNKFFIVICLMLLAAVIPMTAMAAEDSVTIDDTTREILSVPEDETVIRVYNSQFVYYLAHGKTIDEVLYANAAIWDTVYVWSSDGETQCKSIAEGQAETPSESESHAGSYFLEKHKKHKSILHTLVLNAQIKEVYYVSNCISIMSSYSIEESLIYYVTDKGDYVMYDPDMAEEGDEYLMTIEDFLPNAREITEWRQTRSVGTGKFVMTPSGLAAYKISGYRWRNALLWGIPVVLIAGGAGVFVYLKKKRRTADAA